MVLRLGTAFYIGSAVCAACGLRLSEVAVAVDCPAHWFGGVWDEWMNVIPTPKNGKKCKCSRKITSWESWDMFEFFIPFLNFLEHVEKGTCRNCLVEQTSKNQSTNNVVSVFPMVFLMAKRLKKQLWIKSGLFYFGGDDMKRKRSTELGECFAALPESRVLFRARTISPRSPNLSLSSDQMQIINIMIYVSTWHT